MVRKTKQITCKKKRYHGYRLFHRFYRLAAEAVPSEKLNVNNIRQPSLVPFELDKEPRLSLAP